MKHATATRRTHYATAMNEGEIARLKLEVELRQALKNNEFLLHLQPKVNMASGLITGAEALLRWQHPTKGLLEPKAFMATLQKTGVMSLVSRCVLDAACEHIRGCLDAGLEPVPISVNFSAEEIHTGLDRAIARALASYQVPPRWLEVEISEHALERDRDEAASSLLYVKALGVRLLLDDFGTASSSLSALRLFPVDAIKMDCRLLGEDTIHIEGGAIAEAILGLAERLGLDVVAEGLETRAQWEFLMRNLCHEAQGYAYAKPMPMPQFVQLLGSERRLDVSFAENDTKEFVALRAAA